MTSYLLSIERERLLERGVTVSLFSRAIVGSDEEEEKMEAGEVSFTESEGESGTVSGKTILHTSEAFPFHKYIFHTSVFC